MNIARLILNKVILDKNSLVWFIDSDQDFSIITKRKHYFEIIPNAFSIFHSYSNLFKNKDIKIATGKVVGDPGFSSTQMMRTLLTDLKNIDKPILKKIADDAYFPEIKACFDFNGFAREGFHSNYYVGYPYLKYIQKNTKFFHPFYNILFGHHVTRPMIYNYTNLTIDKNGNLNKILGTGDIVWPGNLIMRKDMLKYPSHFVCSKIRLHGPIYGYLLSKKFEKIYTVNIPCFHKRVHNPLKKIQEYRTGVLYNNNYINIAPLRVKQIEGDIILSYLKNSGFCLNNEFNLEKFRSNYKDILEINLKNIDKIKQLLSEIVNKNDDDVDFLILSIKNSINSIKISKFIKFQKDIDQIIEDIKYLDLNLEKRFKIINS